MTRNGGLVPIEALSDVRWHVLIFPPLFNQTHFLRGQRRARHRDGLLALKNAERNAATVLEAQIM